MRTTVAINLGVVKDFLVDVYQLLTSYLVPSKYQN